MIKVLNIETSKPSEQSTLIEINLDNGGSAFGFLSDDMDADIILLQLEHIVNMLNWWIKREDEKEIKHE
ncbi:MAG: hypothetical protein PHU53_07260 [Thermoplasmata archaeon]|nr:hypothetical protein [Thermoplasmata archaeon]